MGQQALAQLQSALDLQLPQPVLEDNCLAASALLALRGVGLPGCGCAATAPLLRLIGSLPAKRWGEGTCG